MSRLGVKIVHAADFHLDSPFRSLPEDKSKERRREQRKTLSALSDIIKAENADVVLLSGDLFDSGVSYWETAEALSEFLSGLDAHVFISPGNHDYYTSRSPYAFMELPENVHIFKSPVPKCVEIPELDLRVWGAGYVSPSCDDIISRFHVEKESSVLNIMTLHASLTGGKYCPITPEEIAATGLDYLALGHIHTFSGIQKAGDTYYAYPGCIEGRGFDETGTKGVIVGTVDKNVCDLRFVPVPGRVYRTIEIDLTDSGTVDRSAGLVHISDADAGNILRIVFKGQYGGKLDTGKIAAALEGKCYWLDVRDETKPRRELWAGAGEDSLKGLFLSRLKSRYDAAESDEDRHIIALAARYGLAAIEKREEWQP